MNYFYNDLVLFCFLLFSLTDMINFFFNSCANYYNLFFFPPQKCMMFPEYTG